jgi:hypothetical protein
MAYDFPLGPAVGQEFTSGGAVYVWNGQGWVRKGGIGEDYATKVYTDAQDALKVAKAGDTMTGQLNVAAPVHIQPAAGDVRFRLVRPASGVESTISGRVGTLNRWVMGLGTSDAETGNNAGSDFNISRYNDDGSGIGEAFRIVRSTGQVLLNGVPAALLDAMAYNGMQFNGSIDVGQEFGYDVSSSLLNARVADGFIFFNNTATALVDYKIDSLTVPTNNKQFDRCISLGVTTAQASLSGAERVQFNQHIERYRAERLRWGTPNAQPVTLCFWSCHNRTGLYSGAVRNAATDRSCVFSYTQAASNVWQYNSVTIPGCTDGVWGTAPNLSWGSFMFVMGSGPTTLAPTAGVWHNVNYTGLVGQVNGLAATSDVFRITGVCFLPGTQAPTAAQSPLIMRPFDQELVMCQRYWQKSYNYGNAPGSTPQDGASRLIVGDATIFGLFTPVYFKTRMRTTPTLVLYDAVGAAGKVYKQANGKLGEVQDAGEAGFTGGTQDTTSASTLYFHWTADARL